MPTVKEIIERTKIPDTIPDSVKCRWLSELDEKITKEIMQSYQFTPYAFPEDEEKELCVKAPYDNIYKLYLFAMSDFFSGNMANYNTSAILFEQAYSELRKGMMKNEKRKETNGETEKVNDAMASEL